MTLSLPTRTLLPAALLTLSLAVPATALGAASQAGTVLAVGANHTLQVIDAAGAVVSAHLSQPMPSARFGSHVSLRRNARGLEVVSVSHRRAGKVSFTAHVASEHGRQVGLKLSDGHIIHLAPGRPVPRLKPGERVKVVETRSGKVQIRVLGHGSKPTGSASKSGSGSGSTGPGAGPGTVPPAPDLGSDPTTSGVVVAVGTDTLTLQRSDGSSLTLSLPASALSESNQSGDINPCETVNVAYAGSELQELTPTGISSSASVIIPGSGSCASTSDGEADIVGTITAESLTSLTVQVPGLGSETFPQLGEVSDEGNLPGTIVDVTYDPTDLNTVVAATAVELYTTATVDAVDEGATTPTLGVTDDFTHAAETFAADDADFKGIAVGDQVGLLYWVEGGQSPALQADDAFDFTNGTAD